LLQVLEDGRLTDGQGRTVDFRNTVIVMTSNLGSDIILEEAGSGDYESLKTKIMDVIGQFFRPEFINRVDETVVFHSLPKDAVKSIAKIQLRSLRNRLNDHGFELEVDEDALALIAERGFDPVYGARPLKRAIQQLVENPLANKILQGEFKSGDTILVQREGNSIGFK
jgi:ATP-dependent Clp protease ATP-binding subunit ClpB